MTARDSGLADMRARIDALTREARQNEAAWKTNQRFQMRLLDADSIAELLERLTEGMRRHFALDQASLLLVDPDHQIRHLLLDQAGSGPELRDVLFVDALDTAASGVSSRPWLGRYALERHRALFVHGPEPASVALLPLMRQGTLFGSLNLGSRDAARFTPSHASDFLQHLAAIAAYCIENTVNRARLMRSSFRDILTGWYNRRYLMNRLGDEIARSNRDRTPLVCLMIDVDNFKPINDTYGHLAGDAMLRALAERMSAEVRRTDVSARFGGEEFVILLPATDVASGSASAERIRVAVAGGAFAIDSIDERVSMTVSIGISAHMPGDYDEDIEAAGEALLAAADGALYAAKNAGRNRAVRA